MPLSPAPTLDPISPESVFLRRLAIVTLSLILVLALIWFLREFKTILQPLFIAIFLSYVLLPAHRWLVLKGVPAMAAYIVLLVFLLVCLVGLGTLLFQNVQHLVDRLPDYEKRLKVLLGDVLATFGAEEEERKQLLNDLALFQPATTQDTMAQARAYLGDFLNFFSALAITGIYLVFVVVERGHFVRRVTLALTPDNAQRVLQVTSNINHAVSEYLAVKFSVSLLGGVLTMAVLFAFDVDFYFTWGILAFLLNFIPYLGSLVATVLPVLLSLVSLGLWQAIVIGLLLIAMQQFIGVVLEPRRAGQRLNVSPLLILLALSFWGVVWGIVGMILAVPLLVSIKIVLDHIEATKPIAALMANVGPVTPLPSPAESQ